MSHATQLHDRGSLADSMEIMNASVLPGNVYDEVYGQVHARVVSTGQWTLAQALDEEVTSSLGGERSERGLAPRGPEAPRSGTSQRALWTQYGGIFDLHVPKLRRGNGRRNWQSIERYERCWGPLLDQQLLHDALGHSLRDLQEAMPLPLGEVRSLAACHRLVLGLQERAHAFKTARLTTPPPIVLVDGWWRKLAVPTGACTADRLGRQRPVKHQETRVMLTALGLWDDGHWAMRTWQRPAGRMRWRGALVWEPCTPRASRKSRPS